MTPEADTLPEVRPDLVQTDPPALLGGSCASCGQVSFPVAPYCPHCGATGTSPVPLATEGTVYSFAIARFAPPGYTGAVPYAVGIVDLPDGIRVASTLTADDLDALRIGADVRFRLLEVDTDDGPVLSYAYELRA